SKVIRLLEDPLTVSQTCSSFIIFLCLILKELTNMAKILNICADKATEHPEYLPILCEAIKLCRLPFLKERASDELHYAQDVVDFLCHMGTQHNRHRYAQIAFKCFSVLYGDLCAGLQPTSPGYRLQLLEFSDLAQTLLLSMATTENQPVIKLLLLQTLQLLSSSSDMNCASILHVRGAEMICLHMTEADPSGQTLFRSTEILWNLLERGNKDVVTAQLSSLECVVSLKEAFLNQLLNSSQNFHLQLRNDLLVVTTLIAENPNAPLIESLFAKELVVFATFPEMKSRNSLVHNLKLTFNSEDLKMKKLLLNLLVLMSRDFAALEVHHVHSQLSTRVMPALLALVKPPAASSERRSGVRHWSVVQREELQLQALATLNTVAPLMLDDYMSCQGNTCLLLLLDCFHSTGGRGTKKAQLRHCIRLLRSVALLGEESVNQDLCDQGVINQLLGILTQMEANPDEDDLISLEIKADIQLILSTLCDPDMHRKELFGSEGVELTLHFLKKGSDKFYSGLGHNKLILSTIDCVSCIVGCYTTEDYFLAKEGIFLLLDLLSMSPKCVHGVVLATLLELCDNPNTLCHILNWRGSSGQTAPGLLLQLWREEEEALGVPRSQHGGITDPKKPVLSHFHPDDIQLSFPPHVPSAAVLEVSENLRSKIYSIFCKLGFQELPGLSTRDYMTLSIIRRYLDFKVGEVWDEIRKELSLDGVRPISPDQGALTSICKVAEDTARWISEEQNSILEQQTKEDMSQEELLYTEVLTLQTTFFKSINTPENSCNIPALDVAAERNLL
uniref:Cilia- and flagella-associated protein 69 ARM repeats domain-containing protein n=1 Tax=Salarias fasciatus TaxID=181472 RepID=A0A672IRI8_SALFA